MASVCEVVNAATNQCDLWKETITLSEIAITGTQSTQLCLAIASFYSICWILKKSRSAVN